MHGKPHFAVVLNVADFQMRDIAVFIVVMITQSGRYNTMTQTKKCPKCGKNLKTLSHKGDKWLSHTYSFAHVMADKPMCDYSKKLEG